MANIADKSGTNQQRGAAKGRVALRAHQRTLTLQEEFKAMLVTRGMLVL